MVGSGSPAGVWDEENTKRALDELFYLAHQYKASKAYQELLDFITRFRFYSPFNAMLIHIQMPGARFVAPPRRWLRQYRRRILPGARPLVILQPMGPVMFVFDVSQTEGGLLPAQVEKPFEVRSGSIGDKLERTIENSKRDGVSIHTSLLGSQRGGSITLVKPEGKTVTFRQTPIPLRYELELAQNASRESRYATIAHELAHLYCGHLGTPNERWWPDRSRLDLQTREFEAESVAYLVCARSGIDNPSESYLAGYVGQNEQVPSISLECVMKSAGLIESMGMDTLKLRKSQN